MMDKIGVRIRDERSVTTAGLLNRAARTMSTAQCEIRIEVWLEMTTIRYSTRSGHGKSSSRLVPEFNLDDKGESGER